MHLHFLRSIKVNMKSNLLTLGLTVNDSSDVILLSSFTADVSGLLVNLS